MLLQKSSLFTTLFTYLLSGALMSVNSWWQDISWGATDNSRRLRKKQWHSVVGPNGEQSVPMREKAWKENWEAQALELQPEQNARFKIQEGVLRPGDDAEQGNLEGPDWSAWSGWGDDQNEQARSELRTRLVAEAQADGSLEAVPAFILEYAPLVHLYSQEEYWPGDIVTHLSHSVPQLNYTAITSPPPYPNLDDLASLNTYAPFIYLTAENDVEDHPGWLSARFNIPDKTTHRSKAPGTLVWIDKGNGVVDAFWFYFYSYNLGNMVFNVRFGNHVGDWEHSMVRFVNGEPKWIFLSQHAGGDAYTFEAVEKKGKRPVIYSATGTHAMYGTAGKQEYIVPLGLLADNTDTGPLWDLTLNSRMYKYNLTSHLLMPSLQTPNVATEWFYFDGRWGDKAYTLADPRQYVLGGEWHYATGPLGPRWKSLARKSVCQLDDDCTILTQLRAGRKEWVWEMDPLDGGVDVPWWALGGLDWYIMVWSTAEYLVNTFVIKRS